VVKLVTRAAPVDAADARRRADYVRRARARGALERRRRREEFEAQRHGIELAVSKLQQLSAAADHPPVRLRTGFIERPRARALPEPSPERDLRHADEHAALQAAARQTDLLTRPPLTRLVRSPRASQLLLTGFFVAACETQPGQRFNNQRELAHREHGWAALIGDRDSSPRERRRHVTRALDALDEVNLVQLGRPRQHGRYDHFEFRTEDGSDTAYTVPGATSGAVELPAGFVYNGWHLALSFAELATWLMFWIRARRLPDEHDEQGLYTVAKLRRGVYGLADELYESHHELEEFGLLFDAAPGDRRIGREAERRDMYGEPLPRSARRFRVDPNAFDQPAVKIIAERLASNPLPLHLR
jgi:hypothetical protein